GNVAGGTSVWTAVKTILIADLVMSLDNVVAIAAAAQGTTTGHEIAYVAFGLIVSVPIIIWGSTLVLKLIDRYPLLVTLGAGLLGWLAGGMLVSDVFTERTFFHGEPAPQTVKIAIEVIGALLVIGLGKWLAARKRGTSIPPGR